MAAAHLATGHDVLVPQLVAEREQVERFDAVAEGAGARFVELCLDGEVPDERVPPAAVPHQRDYALGLAQLRSARRMATLTSYAHDPERTYRELLTLLAATTEA